MGNCWFRGSSYINRVSTAKSETPKIQSPSERDRSDESRLPSNAREVEAMQLDSAARNPLTAFSFEELRKVTNGFRQDSLIGGGGFGRVYKGAVVWTAAETSPCRSPSRCTMGITASRATGSGWWS
ncbi:hypothetical protein VPH35_007792 [Triticum aestivum]